MNMRQWKARMGLIPFHPFPWHEPSCCSRCRVLLTRQQKAAKAKSFLCSKNAIPSIELLEQQNERGTRKNGCLCGDKIDPYFLSGASIPCTHEHLSLPSPEKIHKHMGKKYARSWSAYGNANASTSINSEHAFGKALQLKNFISSNLK
jgi:hypothetical protein